jgi:hypothetical protein
MRLLFIIPAVLLMFSFTGNIFIEDDCLEESKLTDSLLNVEAAKAIQKKFSTSNSPVYNGKYLRHTARGDWDETKKDGKVIARDMSFTVVKETEKGCKTVNMKLKQDAKSDGTFGAFYVDSAVPGTGSPDCACVKAKKDWLNR